MKDLSDLEAVASLIRALEDPDPDVRWVAAEALAQIGEPSIRPLLAALSRDGDSLELRDSAHLLISCLDDPGLRSLLDPVQEALGRKTAPEIVMEAAVQVLRNWPNG